MSQKKTRWLASVGVAGAVAVGATIGVAGMAGATPARATRPVTTTSFSFDVGVGGLAPSAAAISGSGDANFKTDAVSLSVNVPAVVTKLIPGGSASPEVIDVVEVGGTVYLQIPSLAATVGKPWISIALPAKVTSRGQAAFSKVASALGNVTEIVEFAQSHGATVKPLGSTQVDGVQATGSKIVATLTRKGGNHTIDASVWADASNRLVQANIATSVAAANLTATVNFTGYGDPVVIKAPPPSEVKAIPISTVESFLGRFHLGGHARRR